MSFCLSAFLPFCLSAFLPSCLPAFPPSCLPAFPSSPAQTPKSQNLPPLPPLSFSLSGLRLAYPHDVSAATLRDVLPWISSLGCRGVQLSATAQGLKPRELDRSARRDLAATIRRVGLIVSGVDCLVPPEHFASPLHQDRAVAAVAAACEFASEMSTLLPAGYNSAAVTVQLHKDTPADVLDAMAAQADSHGCLLCELNWPTLRAAPTAPTASAASKATGGTHTTNHSQFRIALDPAAVLMGGLDPIALATRAGKLLSHPRLCDVSTAGRIAPGSPDGRLDLMAYAIALSVAQYTGPLVLDLRTVHDQESAATTAAAAWLAGNAQLNQFH